MIGAGSAGNRAGAAPGRPSTGSSMRAAARRARSRPARGAVHVDEQLVHAGGAEREAGSAQRHGEAHRQLAAGRQLVGEVLERGDGGVGGRVAVERVAELCLPW